MLGNWPATKRARHPSDNGIGDAPFEHCLYDERGAGEAGTGGAPAAIMNAVNDALRPFGGEGDQPADHAGGGTASIGQGALNHQGKRRAPPLLGRIAVKP